MVTFGSRFLFLLFFYWSCVYGISTLFINVYSIFGLQLGSCSIIYFPVTNEVS